MKTCYYELLGVSETCSSTELKKAYRSKALLYHPDKNRDNIEEANEKFTAISQAFQILNDPQEREWYDSHKNQILREDDDKPAGGEQDVSEFYYGLTTDDILKYFDTSIYTKATWFESLGLLFTRIADEEAESCNTQKLSAPSFPKFGLASSDYQTEVKAFYKAWSSFQTQKTFAWYDEYRYSAQQDRKTRRLVEKENKKLRDQAKKDYNETIRHLVSFVKKRDQRVKDGLKQMEVSRQKKLANNASKKSKKTSAQEQFESQDWQENDDLYREIEQAWLEQELSQPVEQDDDDFEHFECIICNKFFKSQSQFKAHESSKKHIKAFKQLRYEMRREGIELGIDTNGFVAEEEESEEFLTADEEISQKEDENEYLSGDDSGEGEDDEAELAETSKDDQEQDETDDLSEPVFSQANGGDKLHHPDQSTDDLSDDSPETPQFDQDVDEEIDDNIDDDIDEDLLEIIESLNRKAKIDDGEGSDDDWSNKKSKSKSKSKKPQEEPVQAKGKNIPKEICNVCGTTFLSRNQLFQHVNTTGHALAGGKSKKKSKKSKK
ncbi:unnamed protein product [Kuraishia capsulata CBS 1993]|uniref:J domain-containing protein n=1 Tax=Kuraishia capsulata CBS 1993 TaxID=1382522 RepID=W6MN90_9ASCO|nr:uncharacterized protein KUCA_T00004095001 [Kuraishia capsulata CBS 1993]CDK28114.1 unnamed protein product [Kuraishia capsulata CBS 1993]